MRPRICSGAFRAVEIAASRCHNPTCVRGILVHLNYERVEVCEMLLGAQLRYEFHFDFTAVQVAGEIEQVCLQQHLAASINGGARSQACNAWQRFGGHTVHTNRENTGQRHTPPARAQVRGREAQLAAQLIALNYPSSHRIRSAQPGARERKITSRQRLTHTTATDTHAFEQNRLNDINRVSERGAVGGQTFSRCLAIASKPEVVADNNLMRVQLL